MSLPIYRLNSGSRNRSESVVLFHPSVWLNVDPFIAFFLDSRDPFVDANNLIRHQLHMQPIFRGHPGLRGMVAFFVFYQVFLSSDSRELILEAAVVKIPGIRLAGLVA